MQKSRIPRNGWVLVCDGAKALLLQNIGDAELLNLHLVEVLHEKHAAAHELGSDRPGRVYQSHGGSRSATRDTDYHARGEAEFISRVAGEADRAVHKHAVRHLTVIAPPKALGVLRDRFTPAVRAVIDAELPKDLAGLSTSEIERHLAA